ncbi:MAG: NADH-quinone oxidoreductase subunit C [Gemmatimonadetes bacterium]|nr:NADH-quinone oxidoreductase subunit C [Gemmatimonadota bacterium]
MKPGTPGGLDAVETGPLPSDAPTRTVAPQSATPSDHPSVAALVARFGDAIRRHRVSAGDQTVVWIDPAKNLEVLRWLKDDPTQLYDMMSDVTGVDYGTGTVDVVYQMFSTMHKRALRVRCELPVSALEIDSVAGLWHSADWLEREVYDLFGVTFRGHPDPRRILMPDDYAEGHPLRKDFPLRGRFSRAEQTRRALAQDVERFYTPTDLQHGGPPQEVLASGHGAPGESGGAA